jgi:hypothetical protein
LHPVPGEKITVKWLIFIQETQRYSPFFPSKTLFATEPLFELACIVWAKLPAPLANGFIRNGDASFGEQFFHLTEAETEIGDKARRRD